MLVAHFFYWYNKQFFGDDYGARRGNTSYLLPGTSGTSFGQFLYGFEGPLVMAFAFVYVKHGFAYL